VPRPAVPTDAANLAAFEALYRTALVADGACSTIGWGQARPMTLVNTSLRFVGPRGERGQPYYFLSIPGAALKARPSRRHDLYPACRCFEQQARRQVDDCIVKLPQ
jgi:hypothetical protein